MVALSVRIVVASNILFKLWKAHDEMRNETLFSGTKTVGD